MKLIKLVTLILSTLILSTASLFAISASSMGDVIEEQSKNFVSLVEDGAITAQVIAKIAMDKAAANANIDVASHNGTLTLTGSVDSQTQANKIIELVSSTPGVKKVDATQLTVKKSHQPMIDWMITAKIKTLFLKEKLFGKEISATTIVVETNNGIVFLSGTADSYEQEKNAIALAKSINGVKEVVSFVHVVTKNGIESVREI